MNKQIFIKKEEDGTLYIDGKGILFFVDSTVDTFAEFAGNNTHIKNIKVYNYSKPENVILYLSKELGYNILFTSALKFLTYLFKASPVKYIKNLDGIKIINKL